MNEGVEYECVIEIYFRKWLILLMSAMHDVSIQTNDKMF
jgi:hypothetical protein